MIQYCIGLSDIDRRNDKAFLSFVRQINMVIEDVFSIYVRKRCFLHVCGHGSDKGLLCKEVYDISDFTGGIVKSVLCGTSRQYWMFRVCNIIRIECCGGLGSHIIYFHAFVDRGKSRIDFSGNGRIRLYRGDFIQRSFIMFNQ